MVLQLSEDEERSSQACSEVTSISQPAKASRKRARGDSTAAEAVSSMSHLIQGLYKRRSERREALDQFDSFGSTVAGIIRSLPPQNSLTAMMKVLEVLQPLQHIHTTASICHPTLPSRSCTSVISNIAQPSSKLFTSYIYSPSDTRTTAPFTAYCYSKLHTITAASNVYITSNS